MFPPIGTILILWHFQGCWVGFCLFPYCSLFDPNLRLKFGECHSVINVAALGSPWTSSSVLVKMNLYDSTTGLLLSFVVSYLCICCQQKTREIYSKPPYSVCTCRGADLSALVREASICALRQDMALQNTKSKKGKKALHKS